MTSFLLLQMYNIGMKSPHMRKSTNFWQAKYFAEDIGAGVGKSVQGLMNGVMQTMSRRSGGSAF